jgi:sugar fermentation stimulation protein A
MKFTTPLIKGTLIKRYKRFMADIELDTGEVITAHCANSGKMLGITDPGLTVWVSQSDNPDRKLAYTWECVQADGVIMGVHTSTPNTLVAEALDDPIFSAIRGDYKTVKKEVKYGTNSRIDFLLTDGSGPDCYLEVKNVHVCRTPGLAEFPDTVTTRGTKHLHELVNMIEQGYKSLMVYIIQRPDCTRFDVAPDLDPDYAEAYVKVRAAGVEVQAFNCLVDPLTGITVHQPLIIC